MDQAEKEAIVRGVFGMFTREPLGLPAKKANFTFGEKGGNVKDETQEAILHLVKAAGGTTTSKSVLASLGEIYPKREIRKHLRILIDNEELEFGEDFELSLREEG